MPATRARQLQRAIGVELDLLARVPGRLADARRDRRARIGARRRVSGWSEMMSHALRIAWSIVPSGASKVCGRQREVADPVHLERPDGVARLVPPDQVERVRRERRLEVPRADDGLARLAARSVDGRVVREPDDAAVRPRLGEQVEVAAVVGIRRAARERVERSVDVLREDRPAARSRASGTRPRGRGRARRRSGRRAVPRGPSPSPPSG